MGPARAITEAESDPLWVANIGNVVEVSEKNPIQKYHNMFWSGQNTVIINGKLLLQLLYCPKLIKVLSTMIRNVEGG